jgi:hypothetical protein
MRRLITIRRRFITRRRQSTISPPQPAATVELIRATYRLLAKRQRTVHRGCRAGGCTGRGRSERRDAVVARAADDLLHRPERRSFLWRLGYSGEGALMSDDTQPAATAEGTSVLLGREVTSKPRKYEIPQLTQAFRLFAKARREALEAGFNDNAGAIHGF